MLIGHRLFFLLRSRLVVRTHTHGLLDQPERTAERKPGPRPGPGLRRGRFRLLGRCRFSGNRWRLLTLARAASPPPAASPAAGTGFLAGFAHRRERRRRRRAGDLWAERDLVLPVVES